MRILPNGNVIITRFEFNKLLNYSSSLPTGTTAGKAWRRAANFYKQEVDDIWWRGEYGEPFPEGHKHQGEVPIEWRQIIVEGAAMRYRLYFGD